MTAPTTIHTTDPAAVEAGYNRRVKELRDQQRHPRTVGHIELHGLYDPDTYDRHKDRHSPSGEHCAICGAPMAKTTTRTRFVHIVDGGTHIAPVAEEYDNPAADLGWWPIGHDCAKRIPTTHHTTMAVPT
jgi:hypothetical protein